MAAKKGKTIIPPESGHPQAHCWIAASKNEDGEWGIGVFWGVNHLDNYSGPFKSKGKKVDPTHINKNRAELGAAIQALQTAKGKGIKTLAVHTDNSYIVNNGKEFLQIWATKGWQDLYKGHPIQWEDEWSQIYKLCFDVYPFWRQVQQHLNVGKSEADGYTIALKHAKRGIGADVSIFRSFETRAAGAEPSQATKGPKATKAGKANWSGV